MRLVQKHIISRNHKWFKEIDQYCFKCKNLYNTIIYINRQIYLNKSHLLDKESRFNGLTSLPRTKVFNGEIISPKELRKWISVGRLEQYYALPTQVAKEVLMKCYRDWKSFSQSSFKYIKDKLGYTGKPKPPNYKKSNSNTNQARVLAEFYLTSNSISKVRLKNGIVKLTGLSFGITSIYASKVDYVRIVPRFGRYVIELSYDSRDAIPRNAKTGKKVPYKPTYKAKNGRSASIDLGVNNLATVAFNTGDRPIIINGKPIKSINRYFNKKLAQLRSESSNTYHWVEKENGDKFKAKVYDTRKLEQASLKRWNRINDYFHKSTTALVNHLASIEVTQLTIGYNNGWKQEINIGKKNNQKFVSIPFRNFIGMLTYKCQLLGIEVVKHEESYTSKCSFLDLEPVIKHDNYKGYRAKRGLFKSKKYGLINADVNAAYNIGRKQDECFVHKSAKSYPISPLVYSF